METVITVITAVIMSGILTTIFNNLFTRQKVSAETKKLQAEADAGCVGTLLSVIRPLKEELEDLQEQITNVKAANEKLAGQVAELEKVNATLRAENEVLTSSLSKIKTIVSSHAANRVRLKGVLETIPLGVLIETHERQAAVVNSTFLKMFEIPKNPEDLIGFDCSTAEKRLGHVIEDVPAFTVNIRRLIENGKPSYNKPLLLTSGKVLHQTYIPLENGEHLWLYAVSPDCP